MEKEMITITKEEYDELVKDQDTLDSLYSGGVDNWDGYEDCFDDDDDDDDDE